MKQLEQLVKNSGIEAKDRKLVVQTLKRFYNLNHWSKDPFKETSRFFRRYCETFNTKGIYNDSERRCLFIQAIHKLTSMATKTYCVSDGEANGLIFCESLFGHEEEKERKIEPLSTSVLSSWVGSLDHLKSEHPDKTIDQRMGRYLSISKDHLLKYHPSHHNVLRLLAENGQVYGSEDLMFSLAKEQELDYKTSAEYFEVFQQTPLEAREMIEYARLRISRDFKDEYKPLLKFRTDYRLINKKEPKYEDYKEEWSRIGLNQSEFDDFYADVLPLITSSFKHLPEINKSIYDTLALPQNTSDTRYAYASLLNSIARNISLNLEETILETGSIIREIIENDSNIIRIGTKAASEIVSLEARREIPLIRPYFEVLKHISELGGIGVREKYAYAEISKEIFKDYNRTEKTLSPDKIQKKCYDCIRSFNTLGTEERNIALRLIRMFSKRLKSPDRANMSIDKLGGVVVRSVSKDCSKANAFLREFILCEGGYENGR